MTDSGLMKTNFAGMKLASTGKVRDIYALDPHLLIVATDRISAFDVIMPNPVPGKGEVLTRMSAFWFEKMGDIIPNHVVSTNPDEYPAACAPYREILRGRSMLVKKAKPPAGRVRRPRLPERLRLEGLLRRGSPFPGLCSRRA